MSVNIFCDPECKFDFKFYYQFVKRAQARLKKENPSTLCFKTKYTCQSVVFAALRVPPDFKEFYQNFCIIFYILVVHFVLEAVTMSVNIFCDPECKFDFKFYYQFVKRAQARLKKENKDRVAAWLEALKKEKENDVRVIYIKFLLIQCITNKLLPPFNEDPVPGDVYEYYRPNETCLDMVYRYFKALDRLRELPRRIDFDKVDIRSTDYLTFVTKHLMPQPGYHFVYGCSKQTMHNWQCESLPPILEEESSDEDVRNPWLFEGENESKLMELKESDPFAMSAMSRNPPMWGSNLSPVQSADETPVDQPTDVSLPFLTPPVNNYYDYMQSVGLRRLPFRPKLPRDSFERSQEEYPKTDLSPIRERDIFYQASKDEFSTEFEDTLDLDGLQVSYSDFSKSDEDIHPDITPPRTDPTEFLQGKFSPDSPRFMSTPTRPKKAPILHSSLELRKKKRPLKPGLPYMVPETRVPRTKLPHIYELERFIESPEKVPPRLPIKDINLDMSDPMVFKKQMPADMLDYIDDSDVLLTESAEFDEIAKFLQEEQLKSPPRAPVSDKQEIESLSPKSSETEYFTSKDYLHVESQSTSQSSLAESEYYSGDEQLRPVVPLPPVSKLAPVPAIPPVIPLPAAKRTKLRVRFNIPETSSDELETTVVEIVQEIMKTKPTDENDIIDGTEDQQGDSFIEESKRDYKWMGDLSGGPGLPTDEEQTSDLWDSFGWWTDDPDEIFQYFPPSPRAGRSLAEIYNIPDRWYNVPPTPPLFSKDRRIREGIGAKRIYAIEEFGMEWFDEPAWTDAEMFFRRKQQASPYTNPRDTDRRSLDMTQFPPPRSPKQILEIEELFKAEALIESEAMPRLHDMSFEDTDFQEMTRSEAIIAALRQGPMPSPKSEDESETTTEDEEKKDSVAEVEIEEEDGEWMDMEILDKTPPSFIKYHKTPPGYTVNKDIDFDESISKYLTEDLKIIHGEEPQSPKEKTPGKLRPRRLSFESPELVSDKYDVIPSPEWKTPKRHIIHRQKDIDWITELPSSLKVAEVTESAAADDVDAERDKGTLVKVTQFKKRKPLILYPGMTQEAVDLEIVQMKEISRQTRSFTRGRQIMKEIKKTFKSPPPAPASPEPEPHIFDEPIPSDLPRALAPPSGWNWKTPEALKKGEYKKPVIRTPTGVSPVRQEPTGFSEDVGLYFESPPREALSPTSAIGALMFSPDQSFEEYVEGKTKEKTPSPIRSPIRSPGGKPIAQQRELERARDEIDFVQIYPDRFDLIDEENEPELYQSPEKDDTPEYLKRIREQEIELGIRPRSPETFKELQDAEIRMLEKEIFEAKQPSLSPKPKPEALDVDRPGSPESPEYKRRAWRQALELYKPRKYDKGQYIRYMTQRRTRSGKVVQIKPYEAMNVIQEEPFNEPIRLLWQGTPARKPEIKEIRTPVVTPVHLRPSIYPNEPTSPDAEYVDFGLPSPRRHEYIPPKPYIESPITSPVTPRKRRIVKKPKKLVFEPELPSSDDEDVIPQISPKTTRPRKPRRIDFDEPQYTPPPAIAPENWTWRSPEQFRRGDIYTGVTITENLMSESPPPELYSPVLGQSPTARPAITQIAHAKRPMQSLLTESPPIELYSPEPRIPYGAVSASADSKTPKRSLMIESPPPGLYSPEVRKSPPTDVIAVITEQKVDEISKETDLLEDVTFDFDWEISYSSIPISDVPKQALSQKDTSDIEKTTSVSDISDTKSVKQDVPAGKKLKKKRSAVSSGVWDRFKSKFRTKKIKKKSIVPDRPILSPIKEMPSPSAVTPEQKAAIPAESSSKRETKGSIFKRKAKSSKSETPPKDKSKESSPKQKSTPPTLKTASKRKISIKDATAGKRELSEVVKEHEMLDKEVLPSLDHTKLPPSITDKTTDSRPDAKIQESALHPMYDKPVRHIIREKKSDKMDDLNIGTPVKVTEPKKRKPLIVYPGMTIEAVEREIVKMKEISRQTRSFTRGRQIMKEIKKTFKSPPPAPGSPEPEPHIFDEPIPSDLPRALAPPSGWNWKTPEALKKGEYKKPVIRTPTGVSPVRQEPTGFSEDVGLYFESPPREALSPTSAIGALMFSPDQSFEEYVEGKTKEKTPSPIRSPIRSPGGKPIAQQRELERARDEIDFVQIYPDRFDLIDEENEPELYQSPEKDDTPEYLKRIREQEIELGIRPRSPETFKELQDAEIRMLEKEIFEAKQPSLSPKPKPEALDVDRPGSPESPEYKRRAWRQALELYKPRKYDKGQYIRYMTERRTRSGKVVQIKPYEAMNVIQEEPFNEPIRLLWQGTPARKPEIKDTRTPIKTPDQLKPTIYPNEPTTPDAEYVDFGLPSPERHEYILPKSNLKTSAEVTPQKRQFQKKPKKLAFKPESSSSEDEDQIAVQPISPKSKRERKPRRIDFDEPIQHTPRPVSVPENWSWRTPRRLTKDDIYADKTITENIMSESPPAELYSPKSPRAGTAVAQATHAGTPKKSLLAESPPADLYSPKLQTSPEEKTKDSPPSGLYIPKLWESPLAEPTDSYPLKSSAALSKMPPSLKRDIIDYYASKEKTVDILEEETIDFLNITDSPQKTAQITSPKTPSRRSPTQRDIESDASTSYTSLHVSSFRRAPKRKHSPLNLNLGPPRVIHGTKPEDRQMAAQSDTETSSSDDESIETVRIMPKYDFTYSKRNIVSRRKLDFDVPSSSEEDEDEEEDVVQQYSPKTSSKQSSLPLQEQTSPREKSRIPETVTESILPVDESDTQIQTATPTTRYTQRSSRTVSGRLPGASYPSQKMPSVKSTPRRSDATAYPITEMISTQPRVSPRHAVEPVYTTPTYAQTPVRLPPKPQPGVAYVSEMTPSPTMMFESDVVTKVTSPRERVSPIQASDVVYAMKEPTPPVRISPVPVARETEVSATPRGVSEAAYVTPTARVSHAPKRRVKFALPDMSPALTTTPRGEIKPEYVTQETTPTSRVSSVQKRRVVFSLPETTSPAVPVSPRHRIETVSDIRQDAILSPKGSPKRSPVAPRSTHISPEPVPRVSTRLSPKIAYGTQELAPAQAPTSPSKHPIFTKPVQYQIRPPILMDTDINIGTPDKYVQSQEVVETEEYITGTYDREKRRLEILEQIKSIYGMSPKREPVPSPERERHILDESIPKELPIPLMGPTDWQWSTPPKFHKVPYKKPVLRTPERVSPIKPEPVGFDSDVSLYFESPPHGIDSPTMAMAQFMSPIISPPRKSPKKSSLIRELADKKATSTPIRSPGGRPMLQEWQVRQAKDEIEIAEAMPGHYMVLDEEIPPEELVYSPPNVIEVPDYLESARLQELSLWGQEPLPTPPRIRKERKRLAAKRAAEEEMIARELAIREQAMAAERAKRTPVRFDDISDSELAELEKDIFGKALTPINIPPPPSYDRAAQRPIGVVRTPTQLNPVWLMAETPKSARLPYEPIPVPEAIRFEQRPTKYAPGKTPPSPYSQYDTPGMQLTRRQPRRHRREYAKKRLDFSQAEDDYGAEELQRIQDQYEESKHDILDESPPEMSSGEQLSILADITDYEPEDFTLFLSPSGHNNIYLIESPFKRLVFTFEDTSPIRTELPDDQRDFKWMD